MQKLTLAKGSLKSSQQDDSHILELNFDQQLDWDSCQTQLQAWLVAQEFIIRESIIGADRFCWRLLYADQACLFNLELLTDCCWFEFEDQISLKAFCLGK